MFAGYGPKFPDMKKIAGNKREPDEYIPGVGFNWLYLH